ncbi:MAG: glutamate--tRNA ligase [Bacteroidales bacterium]|nr:glutamate--tRNA ligase [Bacteroidales bacterium]
MENMKPRVRFAPSPTGPLHIGGVRTALYNYLFAKKHGGTFLLRIEDTDQTRFVQGAEEYIIEAFQWLGLKFDEGVGIGGEFGPYKQSERKPMYKPYAEQLVRDGWAYYAFDTPESLDAKRKEAESQKKTFQYDASTRMSMVNSLTLSAEETEKRIASGDPYVVRFKYPADTDIHVHDLIRGEVVINSNLLDDKVLYKSDGMPTYHLANIVDDHTMQITHVIRGEEWLPSAPLHVMLYKAFGWEAPQFAHLPLLLKPDGNGKLSKRDGDRLGFPVFPLEWHDPKSGDISSGYRESGYLPEAVVNMLALLGWNPGTEQEIFTLDEMVDLFSLEKISKSGAKFSLDKAKWFNHEYIQMKSAQELLPYFSKILDEKGITYTDDYLMKVIDLIKDRLNFVNDFWEQAGYFFEAPTEYSAQDLKKRWKEGTGEKLRVIDQLLQQDPVFDMQAAHDRVMEHIKANEWNMGAVLNSLRIGLVGAARGPELFTMINVLGVEETHKRTEAVIAAVEGR